MEQRDSRPVFYGLAEVIDAHIVAEHLAGFLFADNQRGRSKPDERGIRQSVPHVEREEVVLTSMRLVCHDDDIGPIRELGVFLAFACPELLDQCEDISMILTKQPF